jgi:hypothetical protein
VHPVLHFRWNGLWPRNGLMVYSLCWVSGALLLRENLGRCMDEICSWVPTAYPLDHLCQDSGSIRRKSRLHLSSHEVFAGRVFCVGEVVSCIDNVAVHKLLVPQVCALVGRPGDLLFVLCLATPVFFIRSHGAVCPIVLCAM